MKKLNFLLVFLLVSSAAFSQVPARNSVKAGFTYILFGSGDLSGFNYYNEYNHSINRFLTVAPSFHFGYGSKDGLYLRSTKASFSLDPNLFFSPFRFESSKIRVGIGPSLRFLSDSHPTGGSGVYSQGAILGLPPELPYVIAPLGYSRPLNYWTVGYTIVLEGELNITPRWNAGVRTSFQNYDSGETAANAGLNIGYRF